MVDASEMQKERERLEVRNRQIDDMFLSLYTDKAKGVISEQRFMKLTAAMEQLNTGRADGTINNVAAVDEYMKSRPEVNVKIAAIYEPAEGEEYMVESAGMLRKEDQELCDKISEIIGEMIDDGTLYDLTVQYFGETVADSTSLYQK